MDEKRFVRVLNQSNFVSSLEIWMDRATGVQYLFRHDGYSGGLTVLVDRDGKPLLGVQGNWE